MCHPTVAKAKKDAMLDPTYTARHALLVSSRVPKAAEVKARKVLGGVSSGLTKGWSVVRGLFQA